MLTHLDLFSGIGGFALAAQRVGFQTIAFSELDPYASKILKRHWPDVPNLGDIRNVTKESISASLTMAAPRKAIYDEAAKLYASGSSIAEVAAYYGISRQSMWDVLRRRGVAMRPKERVGEDNVFWRGGTSTGEEIRVGKLVAKAIARGKLIPKPCEVCGATGTFKDGRNGVQAHHDDYNKPLEVRWLCKTHHDEWHRNNQPIRKEVRPKEAASSKIDLLTGGFP